ncbi:MAG: hypothetical protein IT303_20390 [Dehalococcoidia bacterium]|nr:hypothetical protein [Dehalococcoidia bacterium]
MLPELPFLISANSLGVIFLLVFLGSTIIFTIPGFATRGGTQVMWLSVAGVVLLVEAVILVTLVVLTSNGTIWNDAA